MALTYLTQKPAECTILGLSTDTKPTPTNGFFYSAQDTSQLFKATGVVWEPVLKHINVSSLADFPAPVAGVITLADDSSYSISGAVDVSPNRFVCGTRVGINGTNRVNDRLLTSNAGAFFTAATKVSCVFNEIGLRCASGTLLAFSDTGLSMIDCSIGPCANGGNVALSGAFPFTIRQSGLASSFTVGGFTFSGTTTGLCRIFDNTISNSVGTLFAFGSSVFGSIDLGRNILNMSVGQTVVSGTGTANVTNFGKVHNNIFFGGGAFASGFLNTDQKWVWADNIGFANTSLGISQSVTFTAEQTKTVVISNTRIHAASQIVGAAITSTATTTWFLTQVLSVAEGTMSVLIIPVRTQGGKIEQFAYTGTLTYRATLNDLQ